MSNPCSSCGSTTGLSYTITTNSCASTSTSTDASSITYTGPAMSCLEIETNTDLQTILEAINTQVCAAGGDWSGYNYHCLTTSPLGHSITSSSDFVNYMTLEFCNLLTTYNTFIGDYEGTFAQYQTTVTNAINGVFVEFDSACSLFTHSHSLTQVVGYIDAALCTVKTATTTGLASANWNTCDYSVTAPTTLNGAFNEVLSRICGLLPTFNNVSSCINGTSPLETATTTDTLYNTVLAIRNKLCTKPDYDYTTLTSSCTTIGTTLQSMLQNIITKLNSTTGYKITAATNTSGTALTLVANSGTCAGWTINLNPANLGIVDPKVLVSSNDTTSGYLNGKLVAGTGITFTENNDGGNETLTIASTIVTDTKEVKVESGGSEGYLLDKITVADSIDGVIAFTKGNVGDTVQISAGLNYETLATTILNTINSNTTLSTLFCNMACACDCGTTSTVTYRKVKIHIEAESGLSHDLPIALQINQTVLPSAIYNGNLTLTSGDIIETGYIVINDVVLNPELIVILENQDAVNDLYYSVYTTLTDGTTLTTSCTDENSSIGSSSSKTWNPFPPDNNGLALGEIPSNTDVIFTIKLSSSEVPPRV